MSWLSTEQVWQKLSSFRADHQKNYFGFYSSRLGGFSQDPSAMLIPLDDHMVHRGDGIFEAFRVHKKIIVDFDAHLARLHRSAEAVGMTLRWSDQEIRDLSHKLIELTGQSEGLLRLFVSRGEGGFTTNPKECLERHLYIVLTKFKAPTEELYKTGVAVVSSRHVWKEAPFAQIKSCNYLLNVFLKQEANEAGVHFAAGFDSEGFLTESSTENIVLVVEENGRPKILVPQWDHILRGTTLLWVLRLAEEAGILVEHRGITKEMISSCKEAAIVGTTWGVLPIGEWDKKKIPVGPVTQRLRTLLSAAIDSL